jgi:hypothetical protein
LHFHIGWKLTSFSSKPLKGVCPGTQPPTKSIHNRLEHWIPNSPQLAFATQSQLYKDDAILGMAGLDPRERFGCPEPCDGLAQPDPPASVNASPDVVDLRMLSSNGSVGIGGDAVKIAAESSRPVPLSQEMRTSCAPSRKRKAPTLRDEDWEPVKRRVLELYKTCTLSDIVTDLNTRHGFPAK